MKLGTRLVRLERHEAGNPGLRQQWEDMLTRLYAAAVAYREDGCAAPPHREIEPSEHEGLRESAARYAATGSPATISDFFRLAREDGGDDARH